METPGCVLHGVVSAGKLKPMHPDKAPAGTQHPFWNMAGKPARHAHRPFLLVPPAPAVKPVSLP